MSEPSSDLRCEWSDLPVYECAHCPTDAREAARIAASRDFGAGVTPNDAGVISGREKGAQRFRVVSGRSLDEGTPDWTLPGRNIPRSDAPCRYVPGYGHYLRSHLRTCNDRDCLGCEPCERDHDGQPVRHCTCREGCNEHLTPAHAHVAPRCIGKVRATLHAIETLDALMLDVAADTGVESEAANLAGPAADPAQWSARKVYAMRSGAELALMPEEDPHHALWVLGTWDMMLREDY
ncbi:MAG TPA: hypothetical protein VFJ21_09480, partial [Mycobacteriales bacterium]|nr:hypothetical protein [Mycobacteriales bacterium]